MLILPGQAPSKLMADARISVRSETSDGPNVVLTIGNADISFDYETALQLSQWLRMYGKRAKVRMGDKSRTWRTLAILDGIRT